MEELGQLPHFIWHSAVSFTVTTYTESLRSLANLTSMAFINP